MPASLTDEPASFDPPGAEHADANSAAKARRRRLTTIVR
jgi:hypothetical protein